uniref:Uncharacterized protein n=1 Tax=Oryza punctata TaxID=4537 RepID=A0A0E0MGK8_ORYPU
MYTRSWWASERRRPATLGDHEGKTSRTTTTTTSAGRADPPPTWDPEAPTLPLDPLPLPDLVGGEWLAKTKEGGDGDDAVEEEDEGEARWRKGRGGLISGGGTREFRIRRMAAAC